MSSEEEPNDSDEEDPDNEDKDGVGLSIINPSFNTLVQPAIEQESAAASERKRQRKAKKAELARLAEKRRNKKVKLNRLTSISGGGSDVARTIVSDGKADRNCYLCGKKGHEKRQCQQKNQRNTSDKRIGQLKRSVALLND